MRIFSKTHWLARFYRFYLSYKPPVVLVNLGIIGSELTAAGERCAITAHASIADLNPEDLLLRSVIEKSEKTGEGRGRLINELETSDLTEQK